jgi:hypothetical protein
MKLTRCGAFAFGAVAAVGGPAAAQTVIWSVQGSNDKDSGFGSSLALFTDVDGDGIDDLATSDSFVERVIALSGATGAELYRAGTSVSCGFEFPFGVVAGDVDGDTIPEIVAVEASYDNCGFGGGRGLYVKFDARDGTELDHQVGQDNSGTWGEYQTLGLEGGAGVSGARHWWSGRTTYILVLLKNFAIDGVGGPWLVLKDSARVITGIGDLDGDSRSELAILTKELEIFSPGKGVKLGAIAIPSGAGSAFHASCSVGDQDGDGINDFLATSVLEDGAAGPDVGAAYLYSGAAGFPLIWRMEGTVANARFGRSAALGDVDGDGTVDYALSAPGWDTVGAPDGEVVVYSGRTRYALARLRGTGRFGDSISGGSDLNGDAIPDLVVCTSYSSANPPSITAYALDRNPVVVSVTPDRSRWDSGATITIEGANFHGPALVVEVGGLVAGNVQIVSDSRVTADLPIGVTGPADVTVRSSVGAGSLAATFRWTPAVLVEGDDVLGGIVTVRFLLDRNDEAWGFWSIGPARPIATPPYHFDSCVWAVPTTFWFVDPAAASDELLFQESIPVDPALVGTEFLVQALAGPRVTSHPKEAAWTNCGSLTIR